MSAAILPEETQAAVFEIPGYCCDQWFQKKYLAQAPMLEGDISRHHSPDCRVYIVSRYLEGEQPVAMLISGRNGNQQDMYVWKDSLPLTLLDGDHLEDYVSYRKELLGTADGRIGVATPEMIRSFDKSISESVVRFCFLSYQDEMAECSYAIPVIKSSGNRFVYHKRDDNPSAFYFSESGRFPVTTERPYQIISLDKTFRMLDDRLARYAVLPNGRWVVHCQELFQTGEQNGKV